MKTLAALLLLTFFASTALAETAPAVVPICKTHLSSPSLEDFWEHTTELAWSDPRQVRKLVEAAAKSAGFSDTKLDLWLSRFVDRGVIGGKSHGETLFRHLELEEFNSRLTYKRKLRPYLGDSSSAQAKRKKIAEDMAQESLHYLMTIYRPSRSDYDWAKEDKNFTELTEDLEQSPEKVKILLASLYRSSIQHSIQEIIRKAPLINIRAGIANFHSGDFGAHKLFLLSNLIAPAGVFIGLGATLETGLMPALGLYVASFVPNIMILNKFIETEERQLKSLRNKINEDFAKKTIEQTYIGQIGNMQNALDEISLENLDLDKTPALISIPLAAQANKEAIIFSLTGVQTEAEIRIFIGRSLLFSKLAFQTLDVLIEKRKALESKLGYLSEVIDSQDELDMPAMNKLNDVVGAFSNYSNSYHHDANTVFEILLSLKKSVQLIQENSQNATDIQVEDLQQLHEDIAQALDKQAQVQSFKDQLDHQISTLIRRF